MHAASQDRVPVPPVVLCLLSYGALCAFTAGYVVLHPNFFKDATGGVLPEICE